MSPAPSTSAPTARPNLLQLAGWSLGAIAAGVGLAFVLGSNLAWAEDGAVLRAAAFGGISVACGSVAAIVILGFLISLPTVALAMGVVGAGIVRMIGSLMVGLGVFFAASPEGKTFWAAFLAANLLALVVESMWGIVNNKSGAVPAATATVGASE